MFDYHRSKSFQASYDTKLQMKNKTKYTVDPVIYFVMKTNADCTKKY